MARRRRKSRKPGERQRPILVWSSAFRRSPARVNAELQTRKIADWDTARRTTHFREGFAIPIRIGRTGILNAKTWRGKPQPKNLNRSKLRKQRRKNFVENAQFSEIALQRRKEFLPSWRLRSANHENCAFLAKLFSLFVSFVCFCEVLLVAACRAGTLRYNAFSFRAMRHPRFDSSGCGG